MEKLVKLLEKRAEKFHKKKQNFLILFVIEVIWMKPRTVGFARKLLQPKM